jgi:hypothetical protein
MAPLAVVFLMAACSHGSDARRPQGRPPQGKAVPTTGATGRAVAGTTPLPGDASRAYTAAARSRAIRLATDDPHVRLLGADERPAIVRTAPWTTSVAAANDRFIGAVVTIDLGGPQTVDTVWPSWGCGTGERARGILMHVVASNVVNPLVGVDLHSNRVLWIDPGPNANVAVWQRQGTRTTSFPPMTCDDDAPQL